MSRLDHVDNYPEIPVSLASTSTILKTGAWRSVRPVIKSRTAPCSAYCPAGIAIPKYLDEVKEGKLDEAHATFIEHNPFPRITGRVCPHFCEHGCNLAVASERVRSGSAWRASAHRTGVGYRAAAATGARQQRERPNDNDWNLHASSSSFLRLPPVGLSRLCQRLAHLLPAVGFRSGPCRCARLWSA